MIKPWYERPATKDEVAIAGSDILAERERDGLPKRVSTREIERRVLETRCVGELQAWIKAMPGDMATKRAYVERCKSMGVDFKNGTITVSAPPRDEIEQIRFDVD